MTAPRGPTQIVHWERQAIVTNDIPPEHL